MNKTKLVHLLMCIGLIILGLNGYSFNLIATDTTSITVPLGGNGWLNAHAKAKIDTVGLNNWSDHKDEVSIYVRLETPGDLNVAMRLRVPEGTSRVAVNAAGSTLTKEIKGTEFHVIDFGTINVKKAGYIKFNLKGIRKTGSVFAEVTDLLLSGPALAKGAAYVKNNAGNYFYWGHRGPSVHLNYPIPAAAINQAEWFYNEVTVPVGLDVVGSYFMADGFTGGYFGMQVNSPTERHVLFSVWSPYQTDDPKNIPDSMKIKLLRKGEGVHGGEFGSEGSGGQSYLNFPWVAGKTYSFLIHAQADSLKKTTVFTAYFKQTDRSVWRLIASFSRPQSGHYLAGLYSFLENFEPTMGQTDRSVYFGNQWLVDTGKKWHAITQATFTGDATAKANYRKDYAGGTKGHQFYLRNCGFFDNFTPLKTTLLRNTQKQPHPQIDFAKLP